MVPWKIQTDRRPNETKRNTKKRREQKVIHVTCYITASDALNWHKFTQHLLVFRKN